MYSEIFGSQDEIHIFVISFISPHVPVFFTIVIDVNKHENYTRQDQANGVSDDQKQ